LDIRNYSKRFEGIIPHTNSRWKLHMTICLKRLSFKDIEYQSWRKNFVFSKKISKTTRVILMKLYMFKVSSLTRMDFEIFPSTLTSCIFETNNKPFRTHGRTKFSSWICVKNHSLKSIRVLNIHAVYTFYNLKYI